MRFLGEGVRTRESALGIFSKFLILLSLFFSLRADIIEFYYDDVTPVFDQISYCGVTQPNCSECRTEVEASACNVPLAYNSFIQFIVKIILNYQRTTSGHFTSIGMN